MPFKEARVVIYQCNNSGKKFGVRVEKQNGDWIRTWAFPVTPDMVAREKYEDQSPLSGKFFATTDFPGCPYCGAKGFFQCGCGEMSCLETDNKLEVVTCTWCNSKGRLRVAESDFDVSGSAF